MIMVKMGKLIYALLIFSLLLTALGCSFYGFQGGALSPEIETLRIESFPNRAETVNPNLRETFRRDLENKFISQTDLELVDKDGDIVVEGAITGYSVEPVGSADGGRATTNRLNMSITVEFTNNVEEDEDFQRTFDSREEFENNFQAQEDQLMRTLSEDIADQVYEAIVIDW